MGKQQPTHHTICTDEELTMLTAMRELDSPNRRSVLSIVIKLAKTQVKPSSVPLHLVFSNTSDVAGAPRVLLDSSRRSLKN